MARFHVPRTPLADGLIVSPDWQRYFAKMAARPVSTPAPMTLTASPASVKSPSDGEIIIAGGVVTGVSLLRNGWTLAMGANANPVNVLLGDVVTITYTSLPTVSFLGG